MKAIIKGRGYVTDNAEFLGEVTLNGARAGLKWWSAGLYRIPRAGCYFLAGEGNSMTGWRRRVDSGGWAEGQGIVPMNLKEARECLTTAQWRKIPPRELSIELVADERSGWATGQFPWFFLFLLGLSLGSFGPTHALGPVRPAMTRRARSASLLSSY
jgi:hypothetical protein